VTLVRGLRRAAIGLFAVVLLGGAAGDPADRLADPGQEAHARMLFRDVRCLVCQSQSIDESDAPLAHDLRLVVRQQVAQGRRRRAAGASPGDGRAAGPQHARRGGAARPVT
jgi:cytochrome c-type biogenesis protein CcmH/NrfF